MEAIKFYIPFEGFYGSIYESMIDDVVDNEIEEGYLTEDRASKIEYRPMYNEISEHIFDKIIELFIDEFELNLDSSSIKFDGLHSPKYYNFETDKINAVISYNDYSEIYGKMIINENFVEYVNKASKSRYGFWSFYEGIEQVASEPSIFLEYIFQWFALNEYREQVIYETCDNLTEIIYNNLNY